MVDVVEPCLAGGAATPNLPALIAAVVVSIESDEKNSRVGGGFFLAASIHGEIEG